MKRNEIQLIQVITPLLFNYLHELLQFNAFKQFRFSYIFVLILFFLLQLNYNQLIQPHEMLQKMKNCYNKKSISKQIGISITGILLLTAFSISLILIILFCKIKQQEQMLPSHFFNEYNKISLTNIANKWEDLVLSVLDDRNCLINQMRSLINNKGVSHLNITKSPQYINQLYGTKSNQMACLINTKNSTIFHCSMDLYIKFILQAAWPYHSSINAKRFNIIYQSITDPTDIMIKTISSKFDFLFPQPSFISKLIEKQQNQILAFSNFYYDRYGTSNDKLVAFRTKITFPTYHILLQLQTYGSFITQSISTILYSNSTNIVVLSLNKTDSKGYSLVASVNSLNPYINYSKLLQPGFNSWVTPSSKLIFSYTNYLSSSYRIGNLSQRIGKKLKSDYVLVIHTKSATATMEKSVNKFINSTQKVLFIILAIGFAMITIMVLFYSFIMYDGIKTCFKSVKNNIHSYMESPKNYFKILQKIIEQCDRDRFFKPILRIIYHIIKNIESHKRKYHRIEPPIHVFPLNIYDKKFQKKYKINDYDNLKILIQKLNNQEFCKRQNVRLCESIEFYETANIYDKYISQQEQEQEQQIVQKY